MRTQTRPFTVETKGRRASPVANWSSVIDEPSSDDLPSRDVGADASARESDRSPLDAANRVFSAVASTAAGLAKSAASVLAPNPHEPQIGGAAHTAPAAEQGRTGRILPSLVPANPFEQSVQPVAVKPRARNVRRPSPKEISRLLKDEAGSEPASVEPVAAV